MQNRGNHYSRRVLKKFNKYSNDQGILIAIFRIFIYITNDILNLILTKSALFINIKSKPQYKEILFLEPRKQGFGDLLFQTPLFESLVENNYKITIVIHKKHLPVLINNPHISNIIFWDDYKSIISLIIKRTKLIVYLGKSTFLESLVGFLSLSSDRIILDQNIDLWHECFNENHTTAWQKLFQTYIKSSLQFKKPKLYLPTTTEKKYFGIKKIAIVAGVEKKEKRYKKINELIDIICKTKDREIYLIGSCSSEYSTQFQKYDNILKNFVNKIDYFQTLQLINSMDLVIGTEGSLVHMSTTIGIKTIIIETDDDFWKYSNLTKDNKIITLNKNTALNKTLQIVEEP